MIKKSVLSKKIFLNTFLILLCAREIFPVPAREIYKCLLDVHLIEESSSRTCGTGAYNNDYTLCARGGSTVVELFDVAHHRDLGTLRGHTKLVRSVAFSRDYKYLASGSRDRTARLWDVSTQKEIALICHHTDLVWYVAFSDDGKKLFTQQQDEGKEWEWDIASLKFVHKYFNANENSVHFKDHLSLYDIALVHAMYQYRKKGCSFVDAVDMITSEIPHVSRQPYRLSYLN